MTLQSLHFIGWGLAAALVCVRVQGETSRWCRRGESCWPTTAEIAALVVNLGPTESRSLHWAGPGSPYTTAIPNGSPGDQPLWGMNQNLEPLYVQDADDELCIPSVNASGFCKQSSRNSPAEGWQPAFIAWPLTAVHVQDLVSFAREHRLCVSVAGTGHEVLNRHSCNQGLFIRTSLLKNITWKNSNADSVGHLVDSVRLGAGLTFEEIQKSGAEQNPGRFVASGWCTTVGIVGWSIGGGHGPFARSTGLGVDNILEVELVLANSSLVVANATHNSDLFWALKGGGGSTWGVITAITVQAHRTPNGGFSRFEAKWESPYCTDAQKKDFENLFDAYLEWMPIDNRWSGTASVGRASTEVSPAHIPLPPDCETTASLILTYIYSGAETDSAFVDAKERLTRVMPGLHMLSLNISTYANAWAFDESVSAFDYGGSLWTAPISQPSQSITVLLSHDVIKNNVTATLMGEMRDNPNPAYYVGFNHDLRGNDHFDEYSTSISPGFQKAAVHLVVFSPTTVESWYAIAQNSYFSESAYTMTDWRQRYWGASNYDRLLETKRRVDPTGLFWCYHCVGSEEEPGRRLDAVII